MPKSRPRLDAVEGDDGQVVLHVRWDGELEGWASIATYAVADEAPVLAELCIRPATEKVPQGGMTTAVLRGVSVVQLYRLLVRQPRMRQLASVALGITAPDEYTQIRRPGRAGRPDGFYALWAARFVELIQAGSRRPIPDLAAKYGVPERTAKNYVHRAQQRSLLKGGKQGQINGVLTDKGRRALADLRREQRREQKGRAG